MLQRGWRQIKEYLFPFFCAGCGVEGEWWCKNCRGKAKTKSWEFCLVCGNKVGQGKICEKCRAVCPLDGATAFFVYEDKEPISVLIKHFKYRFAKDISSVWQVVVSERLPALSNLWPKNEKIVFIPVPLHPKRQRERGYNQARLIAQAVVSCGQKIGCNFELDAGNLTRTRATLPQAQLSREQRLKNLSDAFVWDTKKPAPKYIVLVDDVFTTGATLGECAKVLRKNGCQWVWALTLAHG